MTPWFDAHTDGRIDNPPEVPGSEGGSAKLSDLVVREAIITDLKATTKEAAIDEIVRSLHHTGCFSEADQEEQGSGSEMPGNEKGGPPPADTACQWSDQKRSLGQEIASFRRIDVEPPRTSVLGRFLEGKSPSTGGQAARETTICRRSGGKQSQRAERPARPAW
jgi:hypothetical protein